ncbi:hypothetical protein EDB19DRAFT_525403 [Suillus lakei]|nr:hypothetical protein EDB19DRAFT_525403 [Suillus lakei]
MLHHTYSHIFLLCLCLSTSIVARFVCIHLYFFDNGSFMLVRSHIRLHMSVFVRIRCRTIRLHSFALCWCRGVRVHWHLVMYVFIVPVCLQLVSTSSSYLDMYRCRVL